MNKSILIVFVYTCLITYGVECKGGRGGGGRGGRGGFSRGGGHSWGGGHSSWGGHSSGGGHSSWSSGSRHTYPSHNGLSGNSGYGSSGSAHNYPSGGGLSGHGTGYGGSHSYPPSPGLSGSNRGSTWGNSGYNGKPTTYHGGSNRGSGYTYNTYGHGYGYVPYTYHTAPQTVYINQYRNTDSTYSNLLTGLALYNLGRSHSHHYHHYYEDDYYRRRYSSEGQQRPYEVSGEKAKCYLRISGDGKEQRLSIPCEIVSTVVDETEIVVLNTTKVVCENVTVAVNNSAPLNIDKSNLHFDFPSPPLNPIYDPEIDRLLQRVNELNNELNSHLYISRPASETVSTSSTTETSILLDNPFYYFTPTTQSTPEKNDVTPAPITSTSPVVITTTEKPKTIIQTICKNVTVLQNVTGTDPLTQRGQKVEVTSSTKCTVEIVTGGSLLRHRVDCKALEAYAKMPEPKKESPLTPSRNTLKSWLDSPPWWLSMFIAV